MTAGNGPGFAQMCGPAASHEARLKLRILATTDLHGHLMPWDDLTDRPAPDRGLASVASLIAAARAEQPQALLLDNGDFLNGSPLGDHLAEAGNLRAGAVHPMIAAMNALGYDAATLGNHEFSHGLGHLRRALRFARFPVVSANLDRVSGARRRGFLPRHVMLRRSFNDSTGIPHELTIAIVGFLPPQTTLWERGQVRGRLEAGDILEAARRAGPRLRRAGADLVIALAHSGLGDGTDRAGSENVARALAALPGVDAVIAGHTHQLFPPLQGGRAEMEGPGAALVMPGFFGSHLGIIDLTLAKSATGWRVAAHQTTLRGLAERRGPQGKLHALALPDPAILRLAAADHAAMCQRSMAVVGESAVALQSYFSLIGKSPVQSLLAEAQRDHMRGLLRNSRFADLPLLVAVAPFKAGGRGGPDNFTAIDAGPLTARNLADLYLHPNSPVGLRLTGAEIALWLERAASLFRQITPGDSDQPLIDPDFPAYNFDMIHGLTYAVDLSQPARFDATGREVWPTARRIGNLCHEGRPLRDEEVFLLASNSYRATGGAGFAGADAAHTVLEDATPLRRVLEVHLGRMRRVAPACQTDWHFAPLSGATVTIESSPRAAALAAEVGLEAVGPRPSGFMRFRLRL